MTCKDGIESFMKDIYRVLRLILDVWCDEH
jgi:hypothetical protein